MSSPDQPDLVEGLKAIAGALGISLRTLHGYLDLPSGERPPIRWRRQGYYAYRVKLEAWSHAGDMDVGVYREMKRAGRLKAADRGRFVPVQSRPSFGESAPPEEQASAA